MAELDPNDIKSLVNGIPSLLAISLTFSMLAVESPEAAGVAAAAGAGAGDGAGVVTAGAAVAIPFYASTLAITDYASAPAPAAPSYPRSANSGTAT